MESVLKYALVADSAFFDAVSGKVSVIGLFADISIPEDKDSIPVNFVVAGELKVDTAITGEKFDITVNILKPDGIVLNTEHVYGSFDKAGGGVQFTCFFGGISFSERGKYGVEVLLNGTKTTKSKEHTFFVVLKNGSSE